MFLDPAASEETHQEPKSRQKTHKELQRPVKKTTKKIDKKCLRGKKCLKVAISF